MDHRGEQGLASPETPEAVTFLIGPEGGLSVEEVMQAKEHRFNLVRIGPRVLRTETAPIVAISLAQHLWGDY